MATVGRHDWIRGLWEEAGATIERCEHLRMPYLVLAEHRPVVVLLPGWARGKMMENVLLEAALSEFYRETIGEDAMLVALERTMRGQALDVREGLMAARCA